MSSSTSSSEYPCPSNSLVTPLLTDLYQITMAYAHWKNNRHMEPAIFDLFFRKNPFQGEFTIFCGIDECLKHLANFSFSAEELQYLKSVLPNCDPAFFDDYLANLDCSQVQVFAMRNGTLAFPRIPLLVVLAPLGIGQLLETTLLTLVNYPSLIATNAARMVRAAAFRNDQVKCVEFGLRRAQGPDGGFSASKYSFVGGFVATSNVKAGNLLGVPVAGTHAHSFVQAYSKLAEVESLTVVNVHTQEQEVLLPRVLDYRSQLGYTRTNDGELAAFIAYAAAFPRAFLCLIDTYDTLASGVCNFILVALALDDLGYQAKGVRLDSGDLAHLSRMCAKEFQRVAQLLEDHRSTLLQLDIVASNDINEAILNSLNEQGHAITVFGIGTNLVTCQAQPSLGCVYKLVEISGVPRMKLSQDIAKVLIPGRKHPYRLYGKDGLALMDVLVPYSNHDIAENHSSDEPSNVVDNPPQAGKPLLCRHPFAAPKRAIVTATKVTPLHQLVFDHGKVVSPPETLQETQAYVKDQLQCVRPDVLRSINATPYKIAVTHELFSYLHELWQAEIPVAELC